MRVCVCVCVTIGWRRVARRTPVRHHVDVPIDNVVPPAVLRYRRSVGARECL